jgi:hypothetical protein
MLVVEVRDFIDPRFEAEMLGKVQFSLSSCLSSLDTSVRRFLPLRDANGGPTDSEMALSVILHAGTPIATVPLPFNPPQPPPLPSIDCALHLPGGASCPCQPSRGGRLEGGPARGRRRFARGRCGASPLLLCYPAILGPPRVWIWQAPESLCWVRCGRSCKERTAREVLPCLCQQSLPTLGMCYPFPLHLPPSRHPPALTAPPWRLRARPLGVRARGRG